MKQANKMKRIFLPFIEEMDGYELEFNFDFFDEDWVDIANRMEEWYIDFVYGNRNITFPIYPQYKIVEFLQFAYSFSKQKLNVVYYSAKKHKEFFSIYGDHEFIINDFWKVTPIQMILFLILVTAYDKFLMSLD